MLRGFRLLNFKGIYNFKSALYTGMLFALTYIFVFGLVFSLSTLNYENMLTTSAIIYSMFYLLNSYTTITEYLKYAIPLQKYIGIRIASRTLWIITYFAISFLTTTFTTIIIVFLTGNNIKLILEIFFDIRNILSILIYLLMYLPLAIVVLETLTVRNKNLSQIAFQLVCLGIFVFLSLLFNRFFYYQMPLYTFILPLVVSMITLKIVDHYHYYKMEV